MLFSSKRYDLKFLIPNMGQNTKDCPFSKNGDS